jgi:hypothetical protein
MANPIDSGSQPAQDGRNVDQKVGHTGDITVAQLDYPYPSNLNFNFTDRAAPPAPKAHDGMTSERTNLLRYGDMNFDNNLARPGFDTLQIDGMPAGVQLKTWADQRGLYFYFQGGMDGRSPHYIPNGLKSIALNGQRKDVDDMAMDTYMGMRSADSNQLDFRTVNGQTDPLAYAFRMSNASNEMMDRNRAVVEQSVRDLPNNAFAHMRLADMLVWDAMRPVRDQANAGATRLELNNGFTMEALVRARDEAGKAADLAHSQGELFAEELARRRQDMITQLPSQLQAASRDGHMPIGQRPTRPYENAFQPKKHGS